MESTETHDVVSRISDLTLNPSNQPADATPQLAAAIPTPRPVEFLPHETLEQIIGELDQVDSICLALTCHRFHDLVLPCKKVESLKALCPLRPRPKAYDTVQIRFAEDEKTDDLYAHLMGRLWEWVGIEYVWCGMTDKDGNHNYIRRMWHHRQFSNCECIDSELRRVSDSLRNPGPDVDPDEIPFLRGQEFSLRNASLSRTLRMLGEKLKQLGMI